MLMRSSGIRIGAISGMQIGDLIPVTYQGQELYKIRVYARTHDEYYSFCYPECRVRAIDPYLDYRKRLGEISKVHLHYLKGIQKERSIYDQFTKVPMQYISAANN